MKNKIKFTAVLTIFLLFSNFKLSAQPPLPVTNSLNCPITIIIEFWNFNNNCSFTSTGYVTIGGGGNVTNITVPTWATDYCFVITDIGGTSPGTCPPTAHHYNATGQCHPGSTYGLTGSSNGACCAGGPAFTILGSGFSGITVQ